MANEEKSNIRPPRRGPMHGPGGMGAPGEKAKDFKGAVKRLFKELNKFKILILKKKVQYYFLLIILLKE